MNVASLELCRELYEMSGWADTNYTYYANGGKHSGTMMHRSMVFNKSDNLPAYDLGYLLRKLPTFHDEANLWLNNDGLSWQVGYATDKYGNGDFHFILSELADTPENAACLLAIELFKQGVLTREAAS